MNKPPFTDRTRLYIGMYQYFESGTLTLAPTVDNTDDHLNIGRSSLRHWPLIGAKNLIISNYGSVIDPISGSLTLSKLADIIRPTKVNGYTYLLVSDRTFIWARHTPDGFIGTNGRVFKMSVNYCNNPLEWFADWRAALPVLMKRLNKRLQEIRSVGRDQRLEYTKFIEAQMAIDKEQAVEIRNNNKRFNGIAF